MPNDGVPIVMQGGEVYRPYRYTREEELEKLAVEHSEELFGKNVHFFSAKKKIVSRSGIGSTPDGYLVDLASDKFFIIEIELSSHDIVGHVMNQLSRFKMAIGNSGTRDDLARFLAATVESEAKVADVSYLARAIEKGVGIFVIIDSVSEQLNEVVEALAKDGTDVRAIPFETYVNSQNQYVHRFTTFTRDALERESKKWTYKWATVPIEKHLEKSDESVRAVLQKLSEEICCLQNAKQVTRKGWTTFQTSPLKNFCTIKILRNGLEVNLKVDEKTFSDAKGVAKKLTRTPAWTFDRVFVIRSLGEVPYAMNLIRQAHVCVGT